MIGNLPRMAVIALLSFSFTFLQAQIKSDPLPAGTFIGRIPAKNSSRLSSELKRLYEAPLGRDPMTKYLQISGDKVVVEISMKGDVQATRTELGKMGFKELGTYGRLIAGLIPVSSLPQLEKGTTIVFAKAALKPVRLSGPGGPGGVGGGGQHRTISQGVTALSDTLPWPVISQGDTAIGSYLARQKYKVDGTGVNIGLVSDSWYDWLGQNPFDSSWLHDELPGTGNPNGHTMGINDISINTNFEGMDQGRAMMEVMHDVAPGATFTFASGFFAQSVVATDIINLADAGCNIIGDNMLFIYNEPFFQDGVIAKAINRVKARGIPYFTVAGDYGFRSYESEFRSSTAAPLGDSVGTAHNFSAPGTEARYLQPMTIPKSGGITVFLQWDQNSYSASGVKSVTTDLDVYLLDKNMQSVGYPGVDDNIANGEPSEALGYDNPTDDTTFYLLIVKRAGPDPGRIKYVMSNSAQFQQPSDNPIPGLFANSMVGHSNAENAITVGSAYYFRTPAYGVNPVVVDSISAKGGMVIDLDTLGNRVAPQARQKPDVIGPDAVNTSFFNPYAEYFLYYDFRARGGDIVEDADNRPNFFGTAAAVAHVMGTAALMIQAQKGNSLTPDRMKSILTSTAADMDDPYTDGFDKGFDYATGYGFIDANKAVGQITPPPPVDTTIQDLKVKPLCTGDAAHTRNWQIVNPNATDVEVSWYLIGTTQHGKLTVSPGDTTFMTNVPYFRDILFPSLVVIYWKNNHGFTRLDLAFGSRAICGQEEVAAANSDELIAGELISMVAALRNGTVSGGTGVNVAEVSPNPSSGMFRLYLSLDGGQQTRIGLFSAEGKQLQTRVIEQSSGYVDIDATGYRAGVYFLQVQNGGFIKTIKLIKN